MQQEAVQVRGWQLESPSPAPLCTIVADGDLEEDGSVQLVFVPAHPEQPCRLDVDCAALHGQARPELASCCVVPCP